MKALLWMIAALISFSLIAIGAKELAATMSTFQALFIRGLIGTGIVTIALFATRQNRTLSLQRIKLHTFRNVFHFAGQYGWFVGLGLLPLAEVFALEFTVPIWTMIIAALFLGETVTRNRLIAISIGFAGVLIIVKPGVDIIEPAAIIVLLAAFAYAVSHSATKSLVKTDTPLAILFFMCMIQLPISFLFALGEWSTPTHNDWFWLFIIGITGLSAHYCMAQAMKFADVVTIVTLDFLRLPLIGVVGIFAYNEEFELSLLIGGFCMLVANIVSLKKPAKSNAVTN